MMTAGDATRHAIISWQDPAAPPQTICIDPSMATREAILSGHLMPIEDTSYNGARAQDMTVGASFKYMEPMHISHIADCQGGWESQYTDLHDRDQRIPNTVHRKRKALWEHHNGRFDKRRRRDACSVAPWQPPETVAQVHHHDVMASANRSDNSRVESKKRLCEWALHQLRSKL